MNDEVGLECGNDPEEVPGYHDMKILHIDQEEHRWHCMNSQKRN